jgi:glutathione synthase/RimK-type ligase-like ATP-grasp enzyme
VLEQRVWRGGVCLATCAEIPELTPDDRRFRDELERRGWRVSVAAWDAAGVAWEDFGAVVLRSTWDYHRRPGEFLDWLAECEAGGVRLLNPPSLVRWNHHKSYLLELESLGLPIVPTVLVRAAAGAAPLAGLLAERGWELAVVKPAVAASAYRTFRTHAAPGPGDEARFAELVAVGDVLVQPFLPEIQTAGELSFVGFGGELSHVVVKRPAPGDFRVQGEYGGRAERLAPPPALLAQASRLAAAVPQPWLFVRIDAVVRDEELLLMELELIEPELFLELDPQAPGRFAAALDRLVAGARP